MEENYYLLCSSYSKIQNNRIYSSCVSLGREEGFIYFYLSTSDA